VLCHAVFRFLQKRAKTKLGLSSARANRISLSARWKPLAEVAKKLKGKKPFRDEFA